MEFDTSNKKKQKEFINGIVEKVFVHIDYVIYRGKPKQLGHSLEAHYKIKIVDDKFIYEDVSMR